LKRDEEIEITVEILLMSRDGKMCSVGPEKSTYLQPMESCLKHLSKLKIPYLR